MAEFITAGEGDFFVQVERAEMFSHLSCVGVGDLPLPKGDLTPVYCPDPAQKGKFKIEGFIQGTPATPTVTITRPLSSVANWLLEQPCDFVGWVTYGCAGQRADPENYDLGVLLFGMTISNSRILAEAVAMGPDNESRVNTNADVSYLDRLLVYRLSFNRLGMNNVAAANGIAFLPQRCEDRCGPARDACQEGYMALDGTLYDAEAKYSLNGDTWTATTADPFAAGGNASKVVVVETAGVGHRAIYARSTSVAGTPAEIAYTSDRGETWTNVDVGSVAGQAINMLIAYGGKLFIAATGGYIYVSEDNADTWDALEEANETTEDLRDIVMYSLTQGYAVGNNNVFLYTTDGEGWNSRVGPVTATNLLSVAVNDKGHVFVGAADGGLYVSESEGATGTWLTRRSFGAGSIDRIVFDDTHRYVGVLIHNTAAGVGMVYRTKNGGASWQLLGGQVGAWNRGLNDISICDQNTLVVVGEVHEGTTFVAKTSPVG